MDAADAKAIALDIVRRRIAKGWSRESVVATTHEGGPIGRDVPGEYLMRAGKIAIADRMPWPLRGDEHSFGIRALLDELDGPQGSLFA